MVSLKIVYKEGLFLYEFFGYTKQKDSIAYQIFSIFLTSIDAQGFVNVIISSLNITILTSS